MAQDLNDGEAFVGGQTKENAIHLLARAEAAGYEPQVVRTAAGGFIVPADILDGVEPDDAEPDLTVGVDAEATPAAEETEPVDKTEAESEIAVVEPDESKKSTRRSTTKKES